VRRSRAKVVYDATVYLSPIRRSHATNPPIRLDSDYAPHNDDNSEQNHHYGN